MIYENTAQNYIYIMKEIRKFEGKGKSRYSREYFAYGVNVSTESKMFLLFGSARENTLIL